MSNMIQTESFQIPTTAVARRLLGVVNPAMREGVLNDIKEAKQSGRRTELVLLIDSPGGAPEVGIELYEKLTEACNSGVLALTTCNIKRTESSAVCIYCAGQIRWCGRRTSFLLHEAAFDPRLNDRWTASKIEDILMPQLRAEIPKLQRLTKRFVEIISLASGKPQSDVAKLLADESTYRCSDAIRDSLSHRVGMMELLELDKIKVYGCPYDHLESR